MLVLTTRVQTVQSSCLIASEPNGILIDQHLVCCSQRITDHMSSDLARSKLEQLKKKVSQLKGICITNISIFGITCDHVIPVYAVCVCVCVCVI